MNPPPNNHTAPRDLGSSSVDSSGINSIQRKVLSESKFQRVLHTPVIAEPPGVSINYAGQKFNEVFQLKQGSYADLPASKITELMKSTSLDNAPTQSLLSVVNGILEESVERRNGEIPHRVACLLRKVVQEIERRISTQNEHLRTQKNLYKAREDKYQSRIRVLEALASGTREESEIEKTKTEEQKTHATIQTEKGNQENNKEDGKEVIRLIKELEEKTTEIATLKQELDNKADEKEVNRLVKELEEKNMEVTTLKQELNNKADDKEVNRLVNELEEKNMEVTTLKQELNNKADEKEVNRLVKVLEEKNMEVTTLKQELNNKADEKEVIRLVKELEVKTTEVTTLKQELNNKADDKEVIRLFKETEEKTMEITTLKQELETMKKTYEVRCSQLEARANDAKEELKQKSQEYEHQLEILRNTVKEHEASTVFEELEEKTMEVTTLKQELETLKKTYEAQCSKLEAQVNDAQGELKQKSQEYEHQLEKLRNKVKEHEASTVFEELEEKTMEVTTLKQELETLKKTYEAQCSKLEAQVNDAQGELKQKSQEYEHQLEKLRNKVKEHEASSLLNYQKWNMKENRIQKSVNFQFGSIQKLKLSWESIKQDVMKQQRIYAEECNRLGGNLKPLAEAAENYQTVLTENRKLFNDLQELKGNIRVFCRIRPFIPGQKEKQSIVEHIAETDLVVANPSKPGKEGLRTFKFNKVFSPASTQAEVYEDIQAFIRSVLDGFNVCIFAYGQTGSGKTYTMSGPNGATSETLGVNYRALDDLFNISSSRKSTIVYDIGVQVIEIYNEQVRDLLSVEATPKKLGILNHSQPNGLAVPDACMQPVKTTEDVIRLMDIGLKNRAKGATAMNERSSRSHSVVSIHVRGSDKKSGSSLQGNLHLVDLAGSERVDRSEATGDRLKEAQHINKSLSALGDVIFSLSQKSAHVPYRNSKLTQLLQSSLGGKAKTLMLVQINSDIKSYSESMSTLKFAERVSGVELGAAKSSKEGRDVRDLMEQVASLKDTILTKDEEIERLQLLKDLKNVYPNSNSEKLETATD